MCNNCGTKRSEMGPAYNNSSSNRYGRQYGYGGQGGYGSQGGYGGQQGSYNNFGMGQASRSYSGSGSNVKQIIVIIVFVIAALLGFLGYQAYCNTPQKLSLGDISVTVPQKVTKRTDSVFIDNEADVCEVYENRNMGFAYIKYDMSDFGLKESDGDTVKRLFLTAMEASFEKNLAGYKMKDSVNDHLRFYFTEDGEEYFSDLYVDVHNNAFYMYIAFCRESKENKYIGKFSTMYRSIDYNV